MWKKKKTIGWFIPPYSWNYNENLASVWIRCLQLIKPLKKAGYNSYINEPQRKTDYSIFIRLEDEKAYDMLLARKKLGSKTIFTSVINRYEMEGNLYHDWEPISEEKNELYIRMTTASDGVVAVSNYISERAKNYNDNVIYMPDPVDENHFKYRKKKSDFEKDRLSLIWCGHSVKATELSIFKNILEELPYRLIVISESRPNLDVDFEYIKWDYYQYPKQILMGDICISPRILDNSYDRGHSNFKITPFLYQGLPAVVSPQDSYLEVVNDGKTGYIANDIEDWFYKLKMLNDDREVLGEMSEKSMLAATRYTIREVVPEFEKFLDKINSKH